MSQVQTVHERVAQADDGAQVRRTARRRQLEQILEALPLLVPEEALMLRQAFEFGAPIRIIAGLFRCDHNTIYRRIRALVARIRSPLFVYAAKHRRSFNPALRHVADLVVLQGRSQREACTATGLSLHQVRKHLLTLTTLAGR